MPEINIEKEDREIFDRFVSNGKINAGLRRLMTQQWNKCSLCQQSIPTGRPAFAGYGAGGTPLYVDAKCAVFLVELATPVYFSNDLDLSVSNDQQLWRYMDFAKFAAMLRERSLYFPRADKLGDPFEGAFGLARRESDWDEFYLSFFRQAIMTPPAEYLTDNLSDDEVAERARVLLKQLKSGSARPTSFFVSCWHANDVESEALWRLYCPPPIPGIAIQSRAGHLWNASTQDASFMVGKVHYLDFKKYYAHRDRRIFCKRSSLSHESEVRAVISEKSRNSVEGISVACDLSQVVEKVVISPFMPPWFQPVLEDVIEKYGFSFQVTQSELLEQPFF